MQVTAEQQATTVPVRDVHIPSEAETAMDVDVQANGERKVKRKAEDSPPAESSKKARIGELIVNIDNHFANLRVHRTKPTPIEKVCTQCLRECSL